MVAVDFIALQNTLKALGFYDFVLPWLLSFAIVFGIIDMAGIFSKRNPTTHVVESTNKGIEAIIALAFAFYVTLFTPFPGFLSSFFSKLFGNSIIVLSGVLVLLLFLGMVGLQPNRLLKDWGEKLFVGLAVLIALLIFLNAGGSVLGFGGITLVNATDWLTLLVFFGIIGFVIWLVVHGNAPPAPAPPAT